MSVYSGFATRKQECEYDYALKNQLIQQIQNSSKYNLILFQEILFNSIEFSSQFKQTLSRITQLEDHKYLQPKLGTSLQSLLPYLRNEQLKEQKSFTNNSNTLSTQQSYVQGRMRCISNQDQFPQKTEQIQYYANDTPQFSTTKIGFLPLQNSYKPKFQQEYMNQITKTHSSSMISKLVTQRNKQMSLNLIPKKQLNFFRDDLMKSKQPPNLESQQYEKSEQNNPTLYEIQL